MAKQKNGTVVNTTKHREEEKRKARNKKRKLFLLAGGAAAAAVILVAVMMMTGTPDGKPGIIGSNSNAAEKKAAAGENLVIPVSDISATAKFYPVTVDGTKLEVLAVKAPDGTIRTAFNTCQVCYSSGRGYYKQAGDVLVCQNCGNRFKMSQVEIESGGCNPWPIFDDNKTVTDESITISYDFLQSAKGLFANWKRSY